MSNGAPVVLVVEDEPDVAETYELWLDGDYEVRRAEDGAAALDAIDDTVDVVLLDRMMPGMSGDEVLATIRERGFRGKVAMVTAVEPDFEIIEMGFDDYVTKPPSREGLRETVADLVDRGEYTDDVREYRSLLATQAALEAEKGESELAESDEFAALCERIETLGDCLAGERDRLVDDVEFVSALRDLMGEEDP